MERLFKALIILMICQTGLPAQVRFFLTFDAKSNIYTVSMMSERTWHSPQNLTATGQVTIKATTGQFFVKNVESHIDNTIWNTAGRVDEPTESPGYDYIFFRLKTPGLTEMPYRAFKPAKLFSFQLESNCATEVMLVNNFSDPFLPPNSRNVNIGNSLGTLGANGEAYDGNISDLPLFCAYANPPRDIEEGSNKPISENRADPVLLENKKLYPNPVANELNVALNWKGTGGKKTILVYNSQGKLVHFFNQELYKGNNRFSLNINDLETGVYNFRLLDDQGSLTLGKVIKVK